MSGIHIIDTERMKLQEITAKRNHPDITDRFGRIWVWKHSDIYTHDDAIALTEDLLLTGYARMSLPHRKLRDNPNYAGLCEICTSEW